MPLTITRSLALAKASCKLTWYKIVDWYKIVTTYSRVFRWNPVLALHCLDPFLPSSLGNSWKSIKTKSISFPIAIFTAISTTAHYHLCTICQPGGVTHTCVRSVNWLNILTESMYRTLWYEAVWPKACACQPSLLKSLETGLSGGCGPNRTVCKVTPTAGRSQ